MPDRWRGLEVLFAGIIAFFTVVLAAVSYYQFDVADRAARAAQASADVARQALEISQRAYISIENPQVKNFAIGQEPRFTCVLRNTGHLPATRISLLPTREWGPPYKGKEPRPLSHGEFIQPAPEDAGDILAPDETKPFDYPVAVRFPASIRKQIGKQHIPQFDIGKVIAGQQELTIMAGVAYMDGFGHARTSWKELLYIPDSRTFIVISSHES